MEHIGQNLKAIGGGLFSFAGGSIGVLFVLAIYFAPTIIAFWREKARAQIALTNLFFGWTGIGWIVALIWSVGDRRDA